MHLDQDDVKAAGLARVHTPAGSQHLVTVESVAAWCVQPGTKVTIRPVVDLNVPITCPGYVPSPALRDQVHLISPTCCFPHCHIPAERADDDHITPWAPDHTGGSTDTWNLAPLCRLHHRVKTFGGWTYTQDTLGTYHWTSPTGQRYRRDRDGTINLTRHPDPPIDWS